jgi:hypothetical protein
MDRSRKRQKAYVEQSAVKEHETQAE